MPSGRPIHNQHFNYSVIDMWWVTVALSTVGKLFIGTTFLMTWLVVSELFPTAIRGIGLGITNGSARLASFVAAYVGLLVSRPKLRLKNHDFLRV